MTKLHAALQRFDQLARVEMDRSGSPGLSLALTNREQIIHAATYGFADVEAWLPVCPEHLFEIGSIGKSFTAILLLQLVEDGLLDLDQPPARYLPWFQVQSDFEPFTLHHLLCHTAGIIRGTDFPADPRFEVWALRNTSASAPPGKMFHYSNVGYKALGLVAEAVSGQTYGQLIQERILDPLGMIRSQPVITNDMRANLARGYGPYFDDRPWRKEHGYAPATWLETNTSDGCIAANPMELAVYLRMLMNGGRGRAARVLGGKAFATMTSPHIDPGQSRSGGNHYGYGLALRFDSSRLVSIGHGGGMVGYHSLIQADLETGFGLVTMTNGRIDQEAIASYAFDVLRAAMDGSELPAVPEYPDRMAVSNASSFAGSFRSSDSVLTIEPDGPGLRLRANDRAVELEARGEHAFIVPDDAFDRFLLQVDRDDVGALTALHLGPTTWTRKESLRSSAAAPDEWNTFAGHYRCHNPWMTNFRVVLRGNELLFVYPSGAELKLLPISEARFRIGCEQSPETLSFDTIVDGEAWRARYSGSEYYRFFTP